MKKISFIELDPFPPVTLSERAQKSYWLLVWMLCLELFIPVNLALSQNTSPRAAHYNTRTEIHLT